MINATPAEVGGDFLTDSVANEAVDFSVTFSDPDGDEVYFGELPIELHDDNDGETTGDIKLTLNVDPDSAKTYRLGSETEGVITIWDDDAPELEINGGESVTEAVNAVATFTVSAEVSPNKPVTIFYTVSEDVIGDAGFLLTATEGNKSRELDFRSGKTEVEFTIPLTSDSVSEPNGVVSVALTADQNTPSITYTVGTPATATVSVVDDDTLPVISLLSDSGWVAESTGIREIYADRDWFN